LFQFVKETHDAKFSNTNTERGGEFDSIIEFWQGNSKSEQFILESFWNRSIPSDRCKPGRIVLKTEMGSLTPRKNNTLHLIPEFSGVVLRKKGSQTLHFGMNKKN